MSISETGEDREITKKKEARVNGFYLFLQPSPLSPWDERERARMGRRLPKDVNVLKMSCSLPPLTRGRSLETVASSLPNERASVAKCV